MATSQSLYDTVLYLREQMTNTLIPSSEEMTSRSVEETREFQNLLTELLEKIRDLREFSKNQCTSILESFNIGEQEIKRSLLDYNNAKEKVRQSIQEQVEQIQRIGGEFGNRTQQSAQWIQKNQEDDKSAYLQLETNWDSNTRQIHQMIQANTGLHQKLIGELEASDRQLSKQRQKQADEIEDFGQIVRKSLDKLQGLHEQSLGKLSSSESEKHDAAREQQVADQKALNEILTSFKKVNEAQEKLFGGKTQGALEVIDEIASVIQTIQPVLELAKKLT